MKPAEQSDRLHYGLTGGDKPLPVLITLYTHSPSVYVCVHDCSVTFMTYSINECFISAYYSVKEDEFNF